jgi:hypothetical protein
MSRKTLRTLVLGVFLNSTYLKYYLNLYKIKNKTLNKSLVFGAGSRT